MQKSRFDSVDSYKETSCSFVSGSSSDTVVHLAGANTLKP